MKEFAFVYYALCMQFTSTCVICLDSTCFVLMTSIAASSVFSSFQKITYLITKCSSFKFGHKRKLKGFLLSLNYGTFSHTLMDNFLATATQEEILAKAELQSEISFICSKHKQTNSAWILVPFTFTRLFTRKFEEQEPRINTENGLMFVWMAGPTLNATHTHTTTTVRL